MNRRLYSQSLPDETPLWESPTLRSIGRATASGTLCVTQETLIFVPNGFNLRRQSPWSTPLANVLSIEIVGRNFEPFSGGMRRRLAVRFDGDEELFLIKDADAAKSALDQFMAE